MQESANDTMLNQSIIDRDEFISYLTQWAVCTASLGLHIWFVIMFYIYGATELFYFNIGSVVLYALLIGALVGSGRKKVDMVTMVAAMEIILHQVLCVYYIGLAFGFQHYMLPTAAYMFLYMTENKKMYTAYMGIAVFSILSFMISVVQFQNVEPVYSLPENVEMICNRINSVAAYSIMLFLVFALSAMRRQSYKEAVKQNKELVRMSEKRTEFILNMSHEIRTPLNAMTGMMEMTLQDEPLSPKARKNLEYIHQTGKGLVSFVTDILDMTKIETGTMNLNEYNYSPRSLLEEISEEIRPLAQKKRLGFLVDVSGKLPQELYGDFHRIRQVLLNLLDNAVKFTREGSISLCITSEIVEGKCSLTFEVEDSGIGIKESDFTKIFDMFEQVEDQKNIHMEGTGLGLTISRLLVSLLGGELSVESSYGEGSRFYFTIIQQIPEGDAGVKKSAIRAMKAPDAKILVVDDNKMNLQVASGLLETFAVQVSFAESGEDALKKVDEEVYDLIFMDYMMPVLDGRETTKQIRAKEGTYCRTVPIVALTANVEASSQEILMREFDDFVAKPIEISELARVLTKWLPEKKQRIS